MNPFLQPKNKDQVKEGIRQKDELILRLDKLTSEERDEPNEISNNPVVM